MKKMYKNRYGFFVNPQLSWLPATTVTTCLRGCRKLNTDIYRPIISDVFTLSLFQIKCVKRERRSINHGCGQAPGKPRLVTSGRLMNESDPRVDGQCQVSGCFALIIYVCPVIHRGRCGTRGSTFKLINITQETQLFPERHSVNRALSHSSTQKMGMSRQPALNYATSPEGLLGSAGVAILLIYHWRQIVFCLFFYLSPKNQTCTPLEGKGGKSLCTDLS